jgi:hypothetical protein
MTIDRDKLKELASDPKQNADSISKALGLGKVHNLYYELQKDPALKTLYHDARVEAKNASPAKTDKPPRKQSAKKSRTPPRNGHANGRPSEELLKKIAAEFSFIDAWGEVSEHFSELRDQLTALT